MGIAREIAERGSGVTKNNNENGVSA
jgi:hypothetical protein